ncbi:MAG: lipid II flippase MurJ [Bacteroidota bacterium]
MLKKWLPGFIGLSVLALLGRLLGLVREILMASKFGASDITDAYLTTLLIFDIAIAANASILSGTLSFFTEINNPPGSSNGIYKIGFKILGLFLLIAILIYPFIDNFILLIFSRSHSTVQIIIDTSRLLFFLLAFILACGFFSAILQRRGYLTNPGRLTIFLNISSILFLIFFSKEIGIVSLPLGLFIGGIFFFAYQIILIQKTKTNEPDNSIDNKFNLFGWSAIVLLIFANSLLPSLSGLIERYFAYNFSEGTFSHYQYAVKIILLPLTIVSFAISTSLLPVQTQSISEGNKKEFMDSTNNGILISVITSSLFALIFSTLSRPITKLIYEHGHFSASDSIETALALQIMSVGLIPFLLNPVLINIFYSLRSVKNLIVINLFFIIMQVVLLILLTKIFTGIEALTITWAIIVWLNNITLVLYLARIRKIRFDKGNVFKLALVVITTAVIALLSKQFVNSMFNNVNESSCVVLLKLSSVGLTLLLVFTSIVYYIFRDRLVNILSYVRKRND